MSASGPSPFAFELLQGSHGLTPSSEDRDRATGPIASWLRSAFSSIRTVLPLSPARTSQRPDAGTGASVRDTAVRQESRPRCRLCGTGGARYVCATCATKGFIELRCGCVERPDGTRYSCDAAIERWLDAPFAWRRLYGPCVQEGVDTWADAGSSSVGAVRV